ncbi:MAG: hypothetical protein CMP10_19650 [Zetaproteobacteria bacterium]|mgnify:CR=1 FL=1|nr:hypothetical protein [Pseudobdellovibrionaceae bacterium]
MTRNRKPLQVMNRLKKTDAKQAIKTMMKSDSVLLKSSSNDSVCKSIIQIQNDNAYGRLKSLNRAALEEEKQS